MSFLEQCRREHAERLQRLSQRAPEAGPMRIKPQPRIIRFDKRGRIIRSMLPPEPKKKIIVVFRPPAIAPPPFAPISVRAIMAVVANEYFVHFDVRVTVKAIMNGGNGGCREDWIVKPRQIAAYLARELTPFSFPEIGRRMGGRDHTTVLYSWRKVAQRIKEDPEFASLIDMITQRIKGIDRGSITAIQPTEANHDADHHCETSQADPRREGEGREHQQPQS
jgi:Bacterial dnaA protein helix-turn-helix